jgi:hypothetical protein
VCGPRDGMDGSGPPSPVCQAMASKGYSTAIVQPQQSQAVSGRPALPLATARRHPPGRPQHLDERVMPAVDVGEDAVLVLQAAKDGPLRSSGAVGPQAAGGEGAGRAGRLSGAFPTGQARGQGTSRRSGLTRPAATGSAAPYAPLPGPCWATPSFWRFRCHTAPPGVSQGACVSPKGPQRGYKPIIGKWKVGVRKPG